MSDTLDGETAANPVQMANEPDSTHTNGYATPQFDILHIAHEESECENERLVNNVATKAPKSKSITDRPPDDLQKYWNFKVLRCHIWRSIVVVFFQNKTNLLFPFGPVAAIAASWNMKHGWVFLFSLLGIAPLAERLGFLTEQLTFYTGPTAAVVNSGLLLMAVMGLLFPAVLHFTHTELHVGRSELALSRFSSCIMLIAYAVYLFFQLKSHRNLYECSNEVYSVTKVYCYCHVLFIF
ncbi:hypothetical protein KI387_003125 [Taxus chinensis]|uniref:Sodium/calcium exchanger membrane region domain-containing protein n=1 Tax=Taxus chinensis TaxID=29808 RepID=A0AA38GY24_TAXCH|nr:hypothetical protein KI387_003125 [Taxus chinensis]